MSAIDPATVAHWLQSAQTGALGTLREGAPFVSHVAVAVGRGGAPVLYLSDLAVHTQGLRADPRCSLMIHDVSAADPQAAWRATFVGRARIDDDEAAAFLARHPTTQVLPGFHAWVVDVDVVRAIAGFGKMGWLDGPGGSGGRSGG